MGSPVANFGLQHHACVVQTLALHDLCIQHMSIIVLSAGLHHLEGFERLVGSNAYVCAGTQHLLLLLHQLKRIFI